MLAQRLPDKSECRCRQVFRRTQRFKTTKPLPLFIPPYALCLSSILDEGHGVSETDLFWRPARVLDSTERSKTNAR